MTLKELTGNVESKKLHDKKTTNELNCRVDTGVQKIHELREKVKVINRGHTEKRLGTHRELVVMEHFRRHNEKGFRKVKLLG